MSEGTPLDKSPQPATKEAAPKARLERGAKVQLDESKLPQEAEARAIELRRLKNLRLEPGKEYRIAAVLSPREEGEGPIAVVAPGDYEDDYEAAFDIDAYTKGYEAADENDQDVAFQDRFGQLTEIPERYLKAQS